MVGDGFPRLRHHGPLAYPWGDSRFWLPLAGEFSVYNAAATLGAVCLAGKPLDETVAAMRRMPPVPGRMQRVASPDRAGPAVFIDYAHTPAALVAALAAVRRHLDGRLICVFGCGGDRDPGKRPMMAQAVEGGADAAIVTSDNPRAEDPESIISDIVAGFGSREFADVEPDRAAAIGLAIEGAQPGDVVLIAGKGHEDFQDIAGQRAPHSDLCVAQAALDARRGVMLLRLTEYLSEYLGVFAVFQYITFRTMVSALTALAMSLALGPVMIRKLAHLQIGQRVREEGPESHLQKAGTPTMGGAMILVTTLLATVLWCDPASRHVWIVLAVHAVFGAIRLVRRLPEGIRGQRPGPAGAVEVPSAIRRRTRGRHRAVQPGRDACGHQPHRALLQGGGGAARHRIRRARLLDGRRHEQRGQSDRWPRRPRHTADGDGERRIGVHRLFGGTRRVRDLLADSLCRRRRRAGGVLRRAHRRGPRLSLVQHLSRAGIHGRCGGLALGAALGVVAVIIRHEIVLLIMGGVFVLETVSVIMQVASFKATGKRVFRMAPIHHHFELKGWPEPRVIVRFWIIALVLVLVGLSTLKIR